MKVGLSLNQVVEMDNSFKNGIPFFFQEHANIADQNAINASHDTNSIIVSGHACPDFDKTETGRQLLLSQQKTKSPLAIKILREIVNAKKWKTEIAEDLYAIACKVQ